MDIKQALTGLEKTKEFLEWKKNHEDSFFSYAFRMSEKDNETPWNLGFYNRKTDKVVTFVRNPESIEIKEEEEVFKKPGTEVKQIDVEKITVPFSSILEKAEELQKKEYPKEIMNKKIAILQNLDKYDTVWNITLITLAFNTINLKISPAGKVLDHKIESLMGMIKK
ncbi:hypothetical protein ISS07_02830 [Candidatus Woesearchaeota archaeon]|nr:hypothetical protein [Candidatus Woesearchaeota archaeon]